MNSERHLDIIRRIVWSQSVNDRMTKDLRASLLDGVQKRRFFSPNEAEVICDLLSEELVSSGLAEDSEPNAKGLLLEEAIDWVRSRVQGETGTGTG